MQQPPPGQPIYVREQPSQPLWQRIGKWVLAAVAGAVIAGVAGAVSPRVAWGWPPGWTDPGDKELKPYVSTIELALQSSAPMRTELTNVTTAINNCRIWPGVAVERLAAVQADRRTQLKLLQSVQPPDAGVDLQQQLFSAYRASLQADTDLIAWLKGVKVAQPGDLCGHLNEPLFQKYLEGSKAASAAKKNFAASFDPVARKFSLPSNWSEYNF
jgi:hypothetical protein